MRFPRGRTAKKAGGKPAGPPAPRTHYRDAYEALMVGRAQATIAFPYFADGFHALRGVSRPGIGTVGVTWDGILVFDPDVVTGWTPAMLANVMCHEVTHIFLRHNQRAVAVGATDAEKGRVWNLAADATINDPMVAGGRGDWPWPPVTSKGLKLPPGLTAEAYYALLLQNPPRETPGADGKGGGGGGKCGSAAGPGSALDSEDDIPGDMRRDASDVDDLRAVIARRIKEVADRTAGSVPAELLREAEDILRPPSVPWQRVLAAKIRHGLQHALGSAEYQWDRPSRVYAWRRDVVGFPRLRQPVPKVGLAADTSGSVGDDDLGDFVAEAVGIVRRVTPQGVDVVSADAAIGTMSTRPVTTRAQIKKLLVGGGGTSLAPALAEFDRRPRGRRPDIVIYATDGFADTPPRPRHFDVVWLLVGEGAVAPAPWGIVVRVPVAREEA